MDSDQLRSIAWASLRMDQLAFDRGFLKELPICDEIACEKKQENLYQRMVQTKISLAEAASQIQTHASKRLFVQFLDRNQDISKKRIKMISTDQIKALKETMQSHHLQSTDQVIVVSPNKWSPQAKKEPLDIQAEITLFFFDQLWIRIPEHESQVPHKVVTLSDIRKTVGPSIEAEQLPMILKNDPVVQWFGFPTNTLLCIDRPGFVSFRRVVDH